MARMRRGVLFVACVAAGLALACGGGAAEKALGTAKAALDQAQPDLERYLPDELKSLQDSLSGAMAAFDRGEHKRALAAAEALPGRIQAASEAARKRKDELLASFGQLKDNLPKRVGSLDARLRRLASSASLPAGLDQATVETARANLESVTQGWTEALAQFDRGEVVAAVARATEVEERVEEMAQVFLPSPARAGK